MKCRYAVLKTIDKYKTTHKHHHTTLVILQNSVLPANILLAILANVAVVYVALKLSTKLEKLLSPGVICIFQKAFGIILLSLAVKLFTSNITVLISDMISA
jgi:multiple antibiotic resistance protein